MTEWLGKEENFGSIFLFFFILAARATKGRQEAELLAEGDQSVCLEIQG
jgi:hypothetical protein